MKRSRVKALFGIEGVRYHSALVINVLLGHEARTATKYIAPDQIVRATRIGKPDKRNKNVSVVLTFGKPNYSEQLFIKKCKKAGEPFPVKKVQLKFWPKKRK